MRPIGLSLLIGLAAAFAAHAADPFAAYLNSTPTTTTVLSEEKSGSGAQAIAIRRFTFPSRGGVNTVYGIFAFPQAAGTYPGILLLHGGGSNAEDLAGLAQGFARIGYAMLAIDLPGICGAANHSSGPWEARPAGEGPRFEVAAGAQNSTLADAEIAGLEAFNWLRAQANVKPAAMGITGFSWGGYSTTILSGLLGDKVKAAYSVYGCGFYEIGSFWKDIVAKLPAAERETWLANLDAGRRAPGMKAAYFLEAASNDTYFWPDAVGATLAAIPSAPNLPNHMWAPNLDHKQLASASAMQRLWFDWHLKGSGTAFPRTRVARIDPQTDRSRKARIEIEASGGVVIDSVRLWYSLADQPWTKRIWIAVPATLADGTWSASLPASLADKDCDWFAQSTDSRGVATASGMQHAAPLGPVTIMRGAARPVNTSPSDLGGGRRILFPNASDVATGARDASGRRYAPAKRHGTPTEANAWHR